MRLFACLIVAPQRGYDEPATLSYAISSFCPTSADGLHRSSLYDCAINVYKLVTRCREGTFYPDEIEIQEAHSKHRKLDSQAALPHPTRDRAPDGLRAQVRPLCASRRDHAPGRL